MTVRSFVFLLFIAVAAPVATLSSGVAAVGYDTAGYAFSTNEVDTATGRPVNRPELYYSINRLVVSVDYIVQVFPKPDDNHLVVPANFEFVRIDLDTSNFYAPKVQQVSYTLVHRNHIVIAHTLLADNSIILSRLRPGKYKVFLTYTGHNDEIVYYTDIFSLQIKQSIWTNKIMLGFYALAILFFLMFFFRLQTLAIRRISRQFRERDSFALQLMHQKDELAVKNKNITDSINYAKRIQSALMPSQKLFKSYFPNSFILHLSKDIVSGDFYWVNEVDGQIFIAAVDCTGHGVPGAFMSIIGFELFRKLTNIQRINRPSEVLDQLNSDFKNIFFDVDSFNLRDGMDLAFCKIDKNRRILEFSGAFNPLYLIRNNSITEIKGDRYSIGLDTPDPEEVKFTNHSLQLEPDDMVYIFSDGFVDQFGGPEGKKYKYRRFRHLLLAIYQLPVEKQHDFLHKSILEWKGNLDQVDDILVMGIRVDF